MFCFSVRGKLKGTSCFLTLKHPNLVLEVRYLALNLNARLGVRQICGNKVKHVFPSSLREKKNFLVSHSPTLLWGIHRMSLLNVFLN